MHVKYPLNETKHKGITALGIASLKGTLSIVKLLVERGADVNLVNR